MACGMEVAERTSVLARSCQRELGLRPRIAYEITGAERSEGMPQVSRD